MAELTVKMEEYRGFITKIITTFPSGDIFAQAEVESRSQMVPMKVIGAFDKFVRPGDWFLAKGKVEAKTWNGKEEHRFVAREILPDLPRTIHGVYGLLDKTFNVGEHGIDLTARSEFVNRYGATAAFKIEKNPEILFEMSSDPQRFSRAILNTWNRRIAGLMPIRLMEEAGAKPDTVAAVMKKYKYETLDILKSNPYELMSVKQVDFRLADMFAQRVGIKKSDPRRVSAAVNEVVAQSLSEGNTYLPLTGIKSALTPFEIEWDAFKDLVKSVSDREKAEQFGITIFNSKMGNVAQRYDTYRNERDIATSIAQLVASGRKLDRSAITKAAGSVLSRPDFSFLSDEQRAAVMRCSQESIAILTGGPGTGKSTVSDAIAKIAEQTVKGPIYLVAPTGKAARRLSETTGKDTQTIHKLLGAKGETGDFKFNRDNKLDKGCFILVDEASMLDTALTKALLDALPEDGRILFVGDKDQLPSVDPGYVLGDMLTARARNGNSVPSAELTEVFRSKGADNLIAPYAKEIKEGTFDVAKIDHRIPHGVAFFEFRKESIVVQVEKVYCDLAERQLKLDPKKDVIVLCPMRKGRGGTHEINTRLQAKANPNGPNIDGWVRPADMDREEPTPRVGDRVMFTKNDDTLGIRNGDVGIIRRVTTEWKGKRNFPAIEVILETDDVVKIPVSMAPYCTVLAYAITGHKSQGSQYKCVIMPISPDHVSMMERTLLYTEWTRAKRYVVLIGDKDTFATGIENTSSSKRLTLLKCHIEDQLDLLPADITIKPAVSRNTDANRSTPIPAPVAPFANRASAPFAVGSPFDRRSNDEKQTQPERKPTAAAFPPTPNPFRMPSRS